jgi:hypothetical protein
MVNVEEFGLSKKISVDMVRLLGQNNRAAIIDQGGVKSWNDTETKKPFIVISINQTSYDWFMCGTAVSNLIQGFGSADTKDWVGGVIKLFVERTSSNSYVNAEVVTKPELTNKKKEVLA